MLKYKGYTKILSFLSKLPLKRFARYFVIISFAFAGLIITLDQGIGFYVRKDIYTDITTVPYRPYGVLLGTSKYIAPNTPNLFYNNRLMAAKNLFDTQKISYLLLSGDNRTLYYNEPRTMARDLKKMGIDEKVLFPDYAGFRTLDSIIRAKEVFKAEPMTIITQRFHCERALFIAKYHHIDAICFTADNPDIYTMTRIRETFARILMLWELFTEKAPYFLGDPEPLPSQEIELS
ncbi:MAG TPA: hypothetical protein DD638_10360 [Pasteurellaceae bacterium]|nr:hypothetical protein [Pasteurellaceae bacterium]